MDRIMLVGTAEERVRHWKKDDVVWAIEERRPFYDTFLRYYNEDLPELTLFQHVYTYAVMMV